MLDLEMVNTVLSVMIILDIGLGVVLFMLGRTVAANQMFAVWMFALAGWTMTILGFYNATSPLNALMWMRAAYVEAILAVMSFWYFSTQFPDDRRLSWFVHSANAATLVFFCWRIMTTDLIVIDVLAMPWDKNVHLNAIGWWVFAIYLIFYFLSAHVFLFMSYLKAEGERKKQLLYLVVSVFVGVEVGGVICNLLMPSPLFLNWSLIWLGPVLSTMVVVPFMAYAIVKHRLFSVKNMLTQILVGYTIIFAIIDLLLARTATDFFIRIVLAAGIVVFGLLLVQRVTQDDERRLKLQMVSEKLKKANAELRELDEARTEFVNIASHQLRTPVSVVKGYLSLMMEGAYGKLSPEVAQKARQMFEMNERLVHLINNFLNMSRIEKKRIEFLITSMDLQRTLLQTVDELQLKAQEKKITLRLERPTEQLPFVKADVEKVREVLINLIDNAVKYSEEGGEIVLRVDVAEVPGYARVLVSDTGIGLTKQERERLFQKFYRAESKGMPHQQGTGIGLYICRTFIEGMGGRIWVERSKKGEGTTFAFTLPIDKDDPGIAHRTRP